MIPRSNVASNDLVNRLNDLDLVLILGLDMRINLGLLIL